MHAFSKKKFNFKYITKNKFKLCMLVQNNNDDGDEDNVDESIFFLVENKKKTKVTYPEKLAQIGITKAEWYIRYMKPLRLATDNSTLLLWLCLWIECLL